MTVFVGAVFGFILSISLLLFLSVYAGLSLAMAIVAAVLLYAGTWTVAIIDSQYGVLSRVLGYVKREVLSSVQMDQWVTTIEIDPEGSADVTSEFKGRVNFGRVKWIPIGIWSGAPQSKFKIEAIDLGSHGNGARVLDVQTIQDLPTYRRILLRFNIPIEQNNIFQCRVKYRLERCFYFGREDYYSHHTNEYTEKLSLRIALPAGRRVMRTWAEGQTEYGDSQKISRGPELLSPNTIVWNTDKAKRGNYYKLFWYAEEP